jgi:hypothetical protein
VDADCVTTLQAIERGIQFRIVGPGTAMGTQSMDISPIAALRDGPIQTPKDLEGA